MITLPLRLAVMLTVWMTLVGSSTCLAQQPTSLPNASYFLGFRDFFDGDYLDAERTFRRNSRSAYRIGNNRYVDSICYWTMQAECYFHMGNYAEAITLYEQALNLYLDHQSNGWQNNIQNRAIKIQRDTAAIARARITWGASKRIKGVARVPDNFQVRFGNRDVVAVLQEAAFFKMPKIDVSTLPRSCVVSRCVCIVVVPSRGQRPKLIHSLLD